MGLIDKAASLVTRHGIHNQPVGTIQVVDPSPLNWLWMTYNTMEELVRVSPDGHIEPAAMEHHQWADERMLEITVREGDRFQDGEWLTAETVKRSSDERQR